MTPSCVATDPYGISRWAPFHFAIMPRAFTGDVGLHSQAIWYARTYSIEVENVGRYKKFMNERDTRRVLRLIVPTKYSDYCRAYYSDLMRKYNRMNLAFQAVETYDSLGYANLDKSMLEMDKVTISQ